MIRHAGHVMAAAAMVSLLATTPAGGADESISWLSYGEGLAAAAESGRLVLIDFHADWCKYCKKMDKETFADPGVIRLIEEYFVPVSVDTEKEREPARRFGVRSLPTIWFLESDGTPLTPLPGFVAAPLFRDVLRYMSSRSFETMSFDA
ncbi:MAG: thioredoxin family protein, partial [Actinobacteria bacterium]|nr:thioredoxin family protein [Actinomycetota bacterium]